MAVLGRHQDGNFEENGSEVAEFRSISSSSRLKGSVEDLAVPVLPLLLALSSPGLVPEVERVYYAILGFR